MRIEEGSRGRGIKGSRGSGIKNMNGMGHTRLGCVCIRVYGSLVS